MRMFRGIFTRVQGGNRKIIVLHPDPSDTYCVPSRDMGHGTCGQSVCSMSVSQLSVSLQYISQSAGTSLWTVD